MSSFYITQSSAEDVVDQCEAGQKISAIKALRDVTNLSLKQAKDVIDVVMSPVAGRPDRNDMHARLATRLETLHDITVLPDWADTIQRATTRTQDARNIPEERHEQIMDALKQIVLVLKEHDETLKDIKFLLED